jgi:hypothetical protein
MIFRVNECTVNITALALGITPLFHATYAGTIPCTSPTARLSYGGLLPATSPQSFQIAGRYCIATAQTLRLFKNISMLPLIFADTF